MADGVAAAASANLRARAALFPKIPRGAHVDARRVAVGLARAVARRSGRGDRGRRGPPTAPPRPLRKKSGIYTILARSQYAHTHDSLQPYVPGSAGNTDEVGAAISGLAAAPRAFILDYRRFVAEPNGTAAALLRFLGATGGGRRARAASPRCRTRRGGRLRCPSWKRHSGHVLGGRKSIFRIDPSDAALSRIRSGKRARRS